MTYQTFEKMCLEAGVKPIDVSKATGIARATFSMWKTGKSTLRKDKQEQVAEYFGTTIFEVDKAEILGLEQTVNRPRTISIDGDILLKAVSAMSDLLNSDSSGHRLYYLDEETAETAQSLFENKDMKLLFDAAKGSKAEDLKLAADFLMRLKKQEENG